MNGDECDGHDELRGTQRPDSEYNKWLRGEDFDEAGLRAEMEDDACMGLLRAVQAAKRPPEKESGDGGQSVSPAAQLVVTRVACGCWAAR